MARAAVFGAREVERARLVGHELHGDNVTTLRNHRLHTERFDGECVVTVGGAQTELDAVPLHDRDGCRVELESGCGEVDRFDAGGGELTVLAACDPCYLQRLLEAHNERG